METGGITYPSGFYGSGISCGIKGNGKKDLSLIFSETPCVAAGTFTTNKFKSYSVLWSLNNIRNDIQAVIINSGNANACNGKENYEKTKTLAKKLSEILKIPHRSILIASTGIIGKPFPFDKISSSLENLVKNMGREKHKEAAEGIITTDTFIKEFQIDTGISGRKKEVVIGGMAKGAGMINPNMATMLAFITTDAVIKRDALEKALKECVENSFNMINIDGDRSTNDMVVCLANGQAKNERIHLDTPEYEKFYLALEKVCIELAKMIAKDGEGAEKFIEVVVKGGWCKKDVRRIAKKVAGSYLVKSAIAGASPNWGRIVAAAGSAEAKLNEKKMEVSICGIKVFDGKPVKFDEEKLRKLMYNKEIRIEIDLKKGNFQATAWGCDLTEEYVRINKEYS